MPVHKGPNCVSEEMKRFKAGKMHSGKESKAVADRKQAMAIALSACGESEYVESLKSLGYSEKAANAITEMFGETFVKSSKKSSSSSSA